jgi:hypothetical protein
MSEMRARTRTINRGYEIEGAHPLPACGVGINIDTKRLASAAEEMQKAIEKVPPEITTKFFC